MIFRGQLTEHFCKRRGIFAVRCCDWNLNPHDYDRRARITRFHLIDNRLQICAGLFDRNAVEGIVDPKLEDKNIDGMLEVRWKTAQPTLRGASAGTGIDHSKIWTDRAQFLDQQHRPGLARTDGNAFRYTIAKDK